MALRCKLQGKLPRVTGLLKILYVFLTKFLFLPTPGHLVKGRMGCHWYVTSSLVIACVAG